MSINSFNEKNPLKKLTRTKLFKCCKAFKIDLNNTNDSDFQLLSNVFRNGLIKSLRY